MPANSEAHRNDEATGFGPGSFVYFVNRCQQAICELYHQPDLNIPDLLKGVLTSVPARLSTLESLVANSLLLDILHVVSGVRLPGQQDTGLLQAVARCDLRHDCFLELAESVSSQEKQDGDQPFFIAHFLAEEPSLAYASARCARAIVAVITSADDRKTLAEWGHCGIAAKGTLKGWFASAGLPAKRSLMFARLARAVIRAGRSRPRLGDVLDVVDKRTRDKWLVSAGFKSGLLPLSLEEFLLAQTLITDDEVIREVRRLLEREGLLRRRSRKTIPIHRKWNLRIDRLG